MITAVSVQLLVELFFFTTAHLFFSPLCEGAARETRLPHIPVPLGSSDGHSLRSVLRNKEETLQLDAFLFDKIRENCVCGGLSLSLWSLRTSPFLLCIFYLQTSPNARNFAQFKIFRVQEQTVNSDVVNATLFH